MTFASRISTIRCVAVMIVAAVCMMGNAQAAESLAIEAQIGSGLAIPTGLADQVYNTDLIFHVAAVVSKPNRTVRGRFKIQYFKLDRPGFILAPGAVDGYFEAFGTMLDLMYAPPLESHVRPYGFVGFGFFSTTIDFHGPGISPEFTNKETRGAFNIGGGADIMWGRFGLYSDICYMSFTSLDDWGEWNLGLGMTISVY